MSVDIDSHNQTVESNDQELYTKLKELLSKAPLLKNLTPKQMEDLCSQARFEERKAGETIVHQGEYGDHFYFILIGQVRVIDVSRQPARLLSYLYVGNFFGERTLLYDSPRAATVDVVVDAELAAFDRVTWNWLLRIDPTLSQGFRDLEQYYEQQSQVEFPGRHLDEVVVRNINRHILAFIATLPGPIALIILGLLFRLLLPDLIGIFTLNIILTVAVVISILWIIYNYADWVNDDFIVTTDRVIHIERTIIYGETREEAPLTRIQDVSLNIPNFLAGFFDYYNMIIKTAGAGNIVFDGIRDGNQMKTDIFDQRARSMERVEASDTTAIRKSLADRMGWEVGPIEVSTLVASGEAPPKKKTELPRMVSYYIPKVKESKGNTITWRKHYFILLQSIALPGLTAITFFYLTLAAAFGLAPFDQPAHHIFWPFLIIWLIIFAWFSYKYDEWQKDIYIVTDTTILDIHGTPFNLGGEKRRQGPFDVIQNTTFETPNFFTRILNMGNVIIETAGTAETFTFDQVYNPKEVQQEIFKRWVAFNENERRKVRAAEERRYTRWLGEYHEMSETQH